MNYSQNAGYSCLTIQLRLREDIAKKLEEYANNKDLYLDTAISYLITESFRD